MDVKSSSSSVLEALRGVSLLSTARNWGDVTLTNVRGFAGKLTKRMVVSISVVMVLSIGSAFYLGLRDTRPVCEENEFGQHCRMQPVPPARARRMSDDPSYALVDLNDTVVSLRWYTARLANPLGRAFGGKHSSLVVTFASGQHLRIEKLGMGEVIYCPTIEKPKCNLNAGDKYKYASGKWLRPTTWEKLHSLMVTDVYHYDVVDDNCHHAVQRVWNGVVIDKARDSRPAPDNYLLIQWSGFLRWWSDTQPDPKDYNDDPTARALSVQRWQGWDEDQDTPGYDAADVRRRRRRAKMSDRCQASMPAGWDNEEDPNCPQRHSSASEGKFLSCDWELSASKVKHFWSSKPIRKDCDSSNSDFCFKRSVCGGGESDMSGSSHYRFKKWASSQSESCHSDESHEIMPMDPRRDLYYGASAPGGDSADSCSRSGSEFSWSSDGRSSGELGGVCGPQELEENLGTEGTLDGAKLKVKGDNYLCQWNCEDSNADVVYLENSESEYSCKDLSKESDADLKVIVLNTGDTDDDCIQGCAANTECSAKCEATCNRIASKSLNSGGAKCSVQTTGLSKNVYEFEPGISPGGIILIIILILLECCCCVCNIFQKCRSRGDS